MDIVDKWVDDLWLVEFWNEANNRWVLVRNEPVEYRNAVTCVQNWVKTEQYAYGPEPISQYRLRHLESGNTIPIELVI